MTQPTTAYCPSQEQTNQSDRDWYYLGGDIMGGMGMPVTTSSSHYAFIIVGALILIVALLYLLKQR